MLSGLCPQSVLHLPQKPHWGKQQQPHQNSILHPDRKRRGRPNLNCLTCLVDCVRYLNTFKFSVGSNIFSKYLNNKCFQYSKQNLKRCLLSIYLVLRNESKGPTLQKCKLPMHLRKDLLLSNSSNQKPALGTPLDVQWLKLHLPM